MSEGRHSSSLISRRDAIQRAVLGTAALAVNGCNQLGASSAPGARAEGRLTARPHSPTKTPTTGLTSMGLDSVRDALLYVPKSYRSEVPASLVVLLHGAGQEAH